MPRTGVISLLSLLKTMPGSIERPGPPPRIPLKVLDRMSHPAGLTTLRLEPLPRPWTPGDCIAVYAPAGGASRPYSLAGGRDARYIELLVRRIEGGEISSWLTGLQAGDRCEVSPPFGWFRPMEPPAAPKVYVATGSGMAPFLSALRSGHPPAQRILWGVRDRGDAVFTEELPGVEVFVSRGDPGPWRRGRVTDGLVCGGALPAGTHVYACGLDAMIDDVAARVEGFAGGEGLPLHRECFFTRG